MPIWLRVICGVVGLVIAAVSLIITVAFYSGYGTDASTQWTFTALAVISLAIKLLAPAAAAYTPRSLATFCLWVGFVAAVIFDSFGVAGYVEMTYGSKTGEASRYADDYKDAKANLSKLETSYSDYAATRPTAEVASALEAARGVAGKCPPRRAHTDECVKVANLEQEQARADERDKREANWREAKSKFDKMQKPSVAADPQAAVVARLGSRIGANWIGDFVALIISILIFIFFEMAGPALVFVALHGQGSSRRQGGPQSMAAISKPVKPHKKRVTSATAEGVLEALRGLLAANGAEGVAVEAGKLIGPQRAFAKACGISASKINRHFGELHAAGSIDMRTGPQGTVISILS